MRVCVENLGVNGCVELGRITVVTGPQRSGKSRLATLVYFLYEFNRLVEERALAGVGFDEVKESANRVLTLLPRYFGADSPGDLVKHGESEGSATAVFDDGVEVELRVKRGAVEVNEEKLREAYAKMLGRAERAKPAVYVPAERLFIVPYFYVTVSLLTSSLRLGSVVVKLKLPVLDYVELMSASLSVDREVALPGNLGSLRVESGKIFYVTESGRFPVETIGSGTSQIIGVVLPIAHVESTGGAGLVVVEEPELNLHANLHLSVADFLSELSRKTNVLVTTHSEYFLAGIGLNIRRGVLKREDVKAYFLKNGTVRELEVSEDGGIELPETIAETIGRIADEVLTDEKPSFSAGRRSEYHWVHHGCRVLSEARGKTFKVLILRTILNIDSDTVVFHLN